MTDKNKLVKDFIQNRPNLSGNKIYNEMKGKSFSIRKSDFYTLLRKVRKLPEPTIQKREKSVPTKYKIKPIKPKKAKKISKPSKPIEIPFDDTKFGKMVKSVKKAHNISEKKAIRHTRKILKIPNKDRHKINQKDQYILSQFKT